MYLIVVHGAYAALGAASTYSYYNPYAFPPSLAVIEPKIGINRQAVYNQTILLDQKLLIHIQSPDTC